MRCLTLADALRRDGAQTIFIAAEIPDALRDRLTTAGHEVRKIATSSEMRREGRGWESSALGVEAQRMDVQATAEALDGRTDWLVADHYLLDQCWEQAARAFSDRILILDDLANRPHDAELLLDHTLGRQAREYRDLVEPTARLLLGPLYALLRPEFAQERSASLRRRRSAMPVQRILISLGTTDVGGLTLPSARAALTADADAAVDIVLGAGAPSLADVEALALREPRVRLHVDSREVARLMRDADLAIGAPGMTSWERCCLGLPTIALTLAENQRAVADALAESAAAEVAAGLDALPDMLASLIGDSGRRLTMTAAAAAVADGEGTKRVVAALASSRLEVIEAAQLRIRPADSSDSEALWLWRNDPTTRRASRAHGPVRWPDHVAWLDRTLTSADRHLFIAERDGHALGMVRFDRLSDAESGHEVSINVRPDARGGGIGKDILAAGCQHWLERVRPGRLEAAIHQDNLASRRIFEAVGFRLFSPSDEAGFQRYLRLEENSPAGI